MMKSNAYSTLFPLYRHLQAVDLLLETESLPLLLEAGMVDEASFPRVCLYLLKCAGESPAPSQGFAHTLLSGESTLARSVS